LANNQQTYSKDIGNLDEKELLTNIAAGDEKAFKKIFDQYNRQLFTYIRGFTHNDLDAEEILQEAFIKLWESRKLLSNVEFPGQYIFVLARNHTFRYLKNAAKNDKLIRELWLVMQEGDVQAEEELDVKSMENVIQEALSHLSPTKQQVFHLRQVGLKHEEISEKLQLSKSTVKNIMVDVMKFLKDYFHQHQISISLILIGLYTN
jgi:RNA polymerase sigma factor (sigma-70 family)